MKEIDLNLEKLKILKQDPVVFAEYLLNFHPFPYQTKILRDRSERLIAVCGRQIGKSTTAAVKLLHFALTHPNTTCIIVSATLRQSMEMFNKVQNFIDSSVVKQSVRRVTRTQVLIKNGSRIICLPSGRYGSTLRGLTVDFAVIDEAAFIYDEVISNVIFPMLATTNGTVWMLTTPWDKQHITYKCFNNSDWSVYHLPSSINPLIRKEFLEEQRRLHGEEKFQTEYEAVFTDDAKSYFPASLLKQCIGEPVAPLNSGEYYGGYDPGGRQDYAAYVVVESKGGTIFVRLFNAVKGKSYTEVSIEVAELNNRYQLRSVGVDQTGLGNPILEHLRELGLPVEGYTLTSRFRHELLSNLKMLLEQKKVVLPNSIELLNSLNCIEYSRTRTGGYIFTHRRGTHDDLAYALALACMQVGRRAGGGVVVKL